MRNAEIALYVLGALFTVYVVAATWRSKDADYHVRQKQLAPQSPSKAVHRRVHWWRAHERKGASRAQGT